MASAAIASSKSDETISSAEIIDCVAASVIGRAHSRDPLARNHDPFDSHWNILLPVGDASVTIEQ
jgi:hypothetical protein